MMILPREKLERTSDLGNTAVILLIMPTAAPLGDHRNALIMDGRHYILSVPNNVT